HYLYPRRLQPLHPLFTDDPPPTGIYTLSLHDALPILRYRPPSARSRGTRPPVPAHARPCRYGRRRSPPCPGPSASPAPPRTRPRSEEHTSELQSRENLVCRLLLEKKDTQHILRTHDAS